MWTVFKVFIEFFTILLLLHFLKILLLLLLFFFAKTSAMWDLSSSTRDQSLISCIGRQSLNHWMAREVPTSILRWNNIPLYVSTTFCLSTHPFMDIWIASILWLMWIMLLWTWAFLVVKECFDCVARCIKIDFSIS